ncbi:lipase family protein [Nocardia sp. NPDC059240]|uniref:lipase family protein n=1 Tax=Nocardia sp. NPDC059240 TaxID=3346786 RepID=UPI003682EE1F
MKRLHLVTAAVLATAALTAVQPVCATAAPLLPTLPGAPTKPDQDPFYAVPADIGDHPDGAVLAARPIDAPALLLPMSAAAWQIRYKTAGAAYVQTATVATLLVPHTPWSGPGPRPLLSYQIAEDAVGTRCAPSQVLRAGFGAGLGSGQAEAVAIAAALANGWAVVVSDYEGPESRFVSYPDTAHAVIDGIRAALDFAPAGLDRAAPIGLTGYSGGGYASMAAAEQQPGYAPELHLTAAAVGGLPADLPVLLNAVNRGPFVGFAIGAIIGLARANPDAGIPALLNDSGRAAVADSATDCVADLLAEYAFRDVADFVTVPDPLRDPSLAALLRANSLGQATPRLPIAEFHSLGDEVVPLGQTDSLLDNYSAAGVSVQRTRAPGDHFTGYLAAQYPAFDYLAQRFTDAAAASDSVGR